MEVNVYVSCHVHVRVVRSGRAAIELCAVRKGWGYTNNEHIHAHLPDHIALSRLTILQTLSCNFCPMQFPFLNLDFNNLEVRFQTGKHVDQYLTDFEHLQ